MHCFQDSGKEAIGLCKHCCRALCQDCISEVNGSVACKGRCEEMVGGLDRLIEANLKALNTKRSYTNSYFLPLGSIFIFFGLLAILGASATWILFGAGSIMLAYYAYSRIRS